MPDTEVPTLAEIASVLGVSAEAIAGQTEVPLLNLILGGITTLVAQGGGGGGTWGSITGTLSNQTDLQAALDLKANLTANTFTRLQTITQGTPNEGILASAGYSLTGTNATGMLDLAGTWNTSGNPVALKLAITNTASGATSRFIEFLAGGAGATSVFRVDKNGDIWASQGLFQTFASSDTIFLNSVATLTWNNDLLLKRKAAATLQLGADAAGVTNQMLTAANRITSDGAGANLTIAPGNGLGGAGGSLILSTFTTGAAGVAGTLTTRFTLAGTALTGGTGASLENCIVGSVTPAAGTFTTLTSTDASGALFENGTRISWLNNNYLRGNVFIGDNDIPLVDDGPHILALRNGANAQTFLWDYTYTDGSNYQGGGLQTGADYIEVAARTAGTGADDIDLRLTPAGSGLIRFGTASADAAAVSTHKIAVKAADGTTYFLMAHT